MRRNSGVSLGSTDKPYADGGETKAREGEREVRKEGEREGRGRREARRRGRSGEVAGPPPQTPVAASQKNNCTEEPHIIIFRMHHGNIVTDISVFRGRSLLSMLKKLAFRQEESFITNTFVFRGRLLLNVEANNARKRKWMPTSDGVRRKSVKRALDVFMSDHMRPQPRGRSMAAKRRIAVRAWAALSRDAKAPYAAESAAVNAQNEALARMSFRTLLNGTGAVVGHLPRRSAAGQGCMVW